MGPSCRVYVQPVPLQVFIDTRYGGTVINSEQFNTAGRTVKTGLTAAVIVSQWTWAATLLQSSTVAWKCELQSAVSMSQLARHPFMCVRNLRRRWTTNVIPVCIWMCCGSSPFRL